MKISKITIIAVMLLANGVALHAAWMDTLVQPFVIPKNSERLDLSKTSGQTDLPKLAQFDLRSKFQADALTQQQEAVLLKEQRRIDRLYRASMKDGAIDEWEELLLERALEHAQKLIVEE